MCGDLVILLFELLVLAKFIEAKVLRVGDVYPWNEMIERATGEPLTAKYFASEFVK